MTIDAQLWLDGHIDPYAPSEPSRGATSPERVVCGDVLDDGSILVGLEVLTSGTIWLVEHQALNAAYYGWICRGATRSLFDVPLYRMEKTG